MKKNQEVTQTVWVGKLTKKEAAMRISQGDRHVFSEQEDRIKSLVQLTKQELMKNKIPRFPWELIFTRKTVYLSGSEKRTELIGQIVKDLQLENKRELRERVQVVLEELLTNAVYHANLLPGGKEKYGRKSHVTLENDEQVAIAYAERASGVFLSVRDNGGKLDFSKIQRAFTRCYGIEKITQIEEKDGGAGLGIYMVFELVRHLKITLKPNRQTIFSCWIDNKNEKSPNDFSFNFFEGE